MKKLKFRAWNERLKKMYEVYEINFDHGIVKCRGKHGTTHTFGIMDLVMMQDTNKKDKNGNVIFEGDVFPAMISSGCAGTYLFKDVVHKRINNYSEFQNYIVIGNKYEDFENIKLNENIEYDEWASIILDITGELEKGQY
jgi:hypothetical protein